ncbi:MAG TPA: hypothetical protein PLC77_05750, partial [Bacteroidales bacterium]|nr:hypothetical protein [Bacteroidales bacterium]
MPVLNHRRFSGILAATVIVILAGYGCGNNPAKFVENSFVGTWQIDTSRISISVSVDAGEAADLQVFLPFITDNYQKIRLLLKEPVTISVAQSSVEDPYTGVYSLIFSSGDVYTSSYKLVRNILFLNLSDKSGHHFTIPCQADGNTLQIFYSTPYMKALIRDYIEEFYPAQAQTYLSILSSITVTLEGLSVYNTRTRGSGGQ